MSATMAARLAGGAHRRTPQIFAGALRCVAHARQSWQNPAVSPTVLQSGPYRLFFFSSDRGQPVHVHVARDRKAAKFWLSPVRLEYNHGFSTVELTRVAALVHRHEADLQKGWNDYFEVGS